MCETINSATMPSLSILPSFRRTAQLTRLRFALLNIFLFPVVLVSAPTAQALAQGLSTATAEFAGVVVDAKGRPVADASVVLHGDGSSESKTAKTGTDGRFTVNTLIPGHYHIRIEKTGGYKGIDDEVTLWAGETKKCEFTIQSSQDDETLPAKIELDERPSFTVAGVSDSAGSGGHGSETRVRTGEALAKETVGLQPGNAPDTPEELSQSHDRLEREIADSKTRTTVDEANLYWRLGNVDEKMNDPLAAERDYKCAAELDPSERNYFSWAAELFLHGAAEPAIEVFGKGAGLYPRSSRMLAGLGAALYSSGAANEASRTLCQAIDLEPANPVPYVFLGKMQEASTTPLPCAEERLRRFMRENPSDARADYYYAVALSKAKRGAEKQHEDLHSNGSSSEATLPPEALLEKAVAIDPKLDAAFLLLGNLRFDRGAFLDAAAAYQQAIAISPSGSEAHYRLSLAYRRLGEESKAKVESETYKALEKEEDLKAERQRRDLGQFLFTLQGPSADPSGRKP